MLPQIDAEVASLVWRLRWLGAGGAAGSLALLAMASWYLHELFFVEKRVRRLIVTANLLVTYRVLCSMMMVMQRRCL